MKYLFIIAMNHAGSTVLEQIISTKENVVDMPVAEEGHVFMKEHGPPLPREIGCVGFWSSREDIYSDPKNYNWPEIEKNWLRIWKTNRKYSDDAFLLEKTPVNIMRLDMMHDYFENAVFLNMVRDPLAIVEGILRKKELDIDKACVHWSECVRRQIEFSSRPNVYTFRYEDMFHPFLGHFDNESLNNHLPEELDIETSNIMLDVHNMINDRQRPPHNLNEAQISRLDEIQLEYIKRRIDYDYDKLLCNN